MSLKDYEIREVEDHEKPAVLDFMMQHYFTSEYLIKSYLATNKDRFTAQEKQLLKKDFRRKDEVMLKSNPCLVAIHRETRKIAAINMMSLAVNPKLPPKHQYSSADNYAFESNFLSEWYTSVVYAAVDIFEVFPKIDAALEIVNVSADPAHAVKGLAAALIGAAVDLARNRKIDAVWGLCTSAYTRSIGEKLGFHSCKDIDVMSFRDSEGNVVYEGMDPHVISVMVLMVNDSHRAKLLSKL